MFLMAWKMTRTLNFGFSLIINSCIENSPRAKKPRLSKSLDKPMRIVIFLTVIELDHGQNINQNDFHCGS